MTVLLRCLSFWVDSEEVEDGFFAVSAVAAGVDADGGEFASLAPAFDGEGGDSQNLGDFSDRKQIW